LNALKKNKKKNVSFIAVANKVIYCSRVIVGSRKESRVKSYQQSDL
jgi:hypothetical protein